MKLSHSFEQCYKLLSITEECCFDDVKKSYRALIQKWHPDRLSGEINKDIATDKLKELNTAYKQLSDYYRQHGILPHILPPLINDNNNASDINPVHAPFTKKKTTQKILKAVLFILFSIIFAVLFFISYPLLSSLIKSMSHSFDKQVAYQAHKQKLEFNPTLKPKTSDTMHDDAFFTYGSTIGKVIMVQGPPDKIEKNIWYYGKSEVHFKDGRVIFWQRDADNPLKAQVNLLKNGK